MSDNVPEGRLVGADGYAYESYDSLQLIRETEAYLREQAAPPPEPPSRLKRFGSAMIAGLGHSPWFSYVSVPGTPPTS